MTWDATEFRQRVQDALDDFLDLQGQRLAPLGPDAERLLAEARAAVSGGKRFRAAFCWWGHLAVAPAADEQALARACASLELLHASALVHDDLMDASDTRRGRPATHRGFEAEHRAADGGRGWRGDPEQYGAAAAILLGDLLLAWADELLRTCGLPLEQVGPALEVLDRTRTEVIAGQFLDVSVQARGRADVDAAMTVLRYKSAKYSIERPLHTGAALAGADEATTAALRSFGLPLGRPRRGGGPARRLARQGAVGDPGRRPARDHRPQRGAAAGRGRHRGADRAGTDGPGRRRAATGGRRSAARAGRRGHPAQRLTRPDPTRPDPAHAYGVAVPVGLEVVGDIRGRSGSPVCEPGSRPASSQMPMTTASTSTIASAPDGPPRGGWTFSGTRR